MTPQAISAALAIAGLIALVVVLVYRLTDRGATLTFVVRERDKAIETAEQASAAATSLNADLIALRSQLAKTNGRLEHAAERIAELEEDNDSLRRSPLAGQYVIINTAHPDDRSFRGVIVAELEDSDGVVLAGAVELQTAVARGGGVDVVEQPVGDIVIPRYSWLQRIKPDEE